MKPKLNTVTTCAASLKLLADFWTLRIIEALGSNPLRYCEIQRAVGNVNPTTLTKKLNTLEAASLISRHEEKDSNGVLYTLTPLGKDTLPVIDAIRSFSKKFEYSQK